MTTRNRGRPTKLTPDMTNRLVWAIQQGATYKHACQYAGISYALFREFINRGEKERERLEKGGKADGATAKAQKPFLDFLDTIKSAEGRMIVQQLMTIEKAAQESWQAAAWKLERRYPQEYGRQIVTVDNQTVDFDEMTDEELEAWITERESSAR